MNEAARRTLRFVAVQLVFVAAFLHLAYGVAEWSRWFGAGFLVPRDLRWPAFVVSGIVIILGIYAGSRADDHRPYYLAGIGAMATYAVGYFLWHLTGHQPLLGLAGGKPTYEPISLQWVIDHATAGVLEFVALASETIAIVLLAILYVEAGRSNHRNDGEGGADAEAESVTTE